MPQFNIQMLRRYKPMLRFCILLKIFIARSSVRTDRRDSTKYSRTLQISWDLNDQNGHSRPSAVPAVVKVVSNNYTLRWCSVGIYSKVFRKSLYLIHFVCEKLFPLNSKNSLYLLTMDIHVKF